MPADQAIRKAAQKTAKENRRAAHTAVFHICEMVSTYFKHINANFNIMIYYRSFGTGSADVTRVLGVPVVAGAPL